MRGCIGGAVGFGVEAGILCEGQQVLSANVYFEIVHKYLAEQTPGDAVCEGYVFELDEAAVVNKAAACKLVAIPASKGRNVVLVTMVCE